MSAKEERYKIVECAHHEITTGENGLSSVERYEAGLVLCEWLSANKPKIRPEDHPGVPVSLAEAVTNFLGLRTGGYLYGGFAGTGWRTYFEFGDTHVIYIEDPR